MGIATWIGAAAAALLLARTAASRGALSVRIEALAVIIAACCYGLVATALDFGGWNEPDWRAALFAFLGAMTILAVARIAALRRGRSAA